MTSPNPILGRVLRSEVAALCREPLPAPPPPDPDLVRLQRTYGEKYRIWCTAHWWFAADRTGAAYTEMERTPWELEERLRNPGKPIGQVNL